MPDFDLNALLLQIKDPSQGIPLLAVLTLVNAGFGILLARLQKSFDRVYLLNFLESRFVYQLLPVAVVGYGALYLHMELLTWVYVTIAALVAGDLLIDLKTKLGELFPRRQG